MDPGWTEDALLDGLAQNRGDALSAFDRSFRAQLMSFGRKLGLSREDTEDAVQDTLIAAVRQIQADRFERRSSLHSWVLAIFSRRCADIRRKNIQRSRRISDSSCSEHALSVADRAWQQGRPDVRLRVREALSSLTPRQRLILVLNKHYGLTSREIAPLVHLGVKTTEGLLTSAKKDFCTSIMRGQEKGPVKRLKD